MRRFKLGIRTELTVNGQIKGVQYVVISVDSNGFERRETEWTADRAEAIAQMGELQDAQRTVARAS